MKKMHVLGTLLMCLALTVPAAAADFSKADIVSAEVPAEAAQLAADRVSVGEAMEVDGIGAVTLADSNYFLEYCDQEVVKADFKIDIVNTGDSEMAYLGEFKDLTFTFGDHVYGARVFRLEPGHSDIAFIQTDFLHGDMDYEQENMTAPGETAVYTIRTILPAEIAEEAGKGQPVVMGFTIGGVRAAFPFYF